MLSWVGVGVGDGGRGRARWRQRGRRRRAGDEAVSESSCWPSPKSSFLTCYFSKNTMFAIHAHLICKPNHSSTTFEFPFSASCALSPHKT